MRCTLNLSDEKKGKEGKSRIEIKSRNNVFTVNLLLQKETLLMGIWVKDISHKETGYLYFIGFCRWDHNSLS